MAAVDPLTTCPLSPSDGPPSTCAYAPTPPCEPRRTSGGAGGARPLHQPQRLWPRQRGVLADRGPQRPYSPRGAPGRTIPGTPHGLPPPLPEAARAATQPPDAPGAGAGPDSDLPHVPP